MVLAAFALFCMSMAAEDPPLCPAEETVSASEYSPNKKEVSLEFINDAGIDLSMFWVNYNGDEIPVCLDVHLPLATFLNRSVVLCWSV